MSEGLAIGVDIGGTSAKLGIVDDEGRVAATGHVKTGRVEPRALADAITAECRRLMDGAGARELGAVGIACAGLVDTARGVVRVSPNLPTWSDVPLRDLLARSLGAPVSLINDANAFGYAEATRGAGKGARVGVYVTLGTGVGGVVMEGERFFEGAHGVAGEIGHMVVDVAGDPCLCGGRGCLETLLGSAPIVARAERKIQSGAPGDAIRRAAGGEGRPITPKAIAEAATAGDWTARSVFAEVGEFLGAAMAGIANVIDPDVVVIGGGVAQAGDVLWNSLREAYARQAIAPEDIRPAIRPARFGPEAGLVGAAAYAHDRR